MTKTPGDSQYDLEDRTYEFARRVRAFVKGLPRTIRNTEDVKQVVRSSGSVGANYIEANEALSRHGRFVVGPTSFSERNSPIRPV